MKPIQLLMACWLLIGARSSPGAANIDNGAPLIRSAQSGRWSNPTTWEGSQVPGDGQRVQIRTGHDVLYDVCSAAAIRSIHVAGALRFDPDCDTRLDVGLIKIQAGDDPGESGFDCEFHVTAPDPGMARPTLEVGAADHPIGSGHKALIRLRAVAGLDPEEYPAIVNCGGRMDFHGAPLRRTWVKLAATAEKDAAVLTLAEPVDDWHKGDRVIITATNRQRVADEGMVPSVRTRPRTEERLISAIDGTSVTLDLPLAYRHQGDGALRGEVANLTRNVIIESADPASQRGHTMYHRHSLGSISYAEFRHLGKPGKLGKYSLHFHRVGDTMRGSSVVGASIWDSGNRFITIHGTNRLVVRDCVGYRSVGHGFFLEDGTEVDNILDRNLAVQACEGRALEGQALAFDRNEGAGFWWANSRNALTRNVAVECDQYGFRFEAPQAEGFDPIMAVRGPDGGTKRVDIRTLPFLRFDDNEAHAQRRYGFNLGGGPGGGATGGVGGVGPDSRHPFAIRNMRVWDAHWAVCLSAPGVLVDGMDIAHCRFGLWRPRYERHAYRKLKVYQTGWAFFAVTGKQPDQAAFPSPLIPTDDRPPVTVITYHTRLPTGRVLVRGVTADDGDIAEVRVNAQRARSVEPNFSQWEVEFDAPAGMPIALEAAARDTAGNTEPTPHRIFAQSQ